MSTTTQGNKEIYLSISQAVKVLKRSPIWIRRLLTEVDGKPSQLQGKKDNEGHWLIARSSIDTYLAKVAKREADRIEKLDAGVTYNYVRPRVMAVKMILEALKTAKVTEAEAMTTRKVVEAIGKAWDMEYEAEAKAKAKKA